MFEKSIIKTRLFAWLLPYTCILCGKRSDRQQDLCLACLKDLPIITQTCRLCANKIPDSASICGSCLKQPPPFKATYTLFAYHEPVTTMILALKFHQQLAYARILGELLAEKIAQEWYRDQILPELIIPVPLHLQRLKERGFNQALEIAKPVARYLNIILDTHAASRIRNTPVQMKLSANLRAKNMKNAFQIQTAVAGKKVVIVDDVMTTGSTVRELAQALLNQGAAEVSVWCCARAS